MTPSRLFHIALTGLKINRLRTLLTTLGIVIGIATVIIVLSVGQSAKSSVSESLSSFGGNTIFAEISVPSTSRSSAGFNMIAGVQVTSLKESDLLAAKKLPNVEDVYGAVMGKEKITYLNSSKRPTLMGTSASYPDIDKTKISAGRFFTLSEDQQMARVIVLGPNLAKDLFGIANPIGQNIKLKQINFKVIGVTEPKGTSFFINMDDLALLPLNTMQKLILGIDYITHFTIQVSDRNLMARTADDLRFLLRRRHHIPLDQPAKDDFQVTTMEDSLELTNSIIDGVTFLLTVIAIISLVVGGVGIMNIMYVSVSERTREIGLRKAIGARSRYILWQFLLEAVTITFVGGIIGIIAGLMFIVVVTFGANYFGFNWPLIISFKAIALGFFASSTVGIVFGLYPARRAARLDPIIALRKE